MNKRFGFWPHIIHVIVLTFKEIKHLSDYRDCRIIATSPRIATLENTLHKAGRKSIPKYRRLKTLKSVGRGIWNRNIDQASKEVRKAHWIWKNKGKSNSSTESERKDMIKKKRHCVKYSDKHTPQRRIN